MPCWNWVQGIAAVDMPVNEVTWQWEMSPQEAELVVHALADGIAVAARINLCHHDGDEVCVQVQRFVISCWSCCWGGVLDQVV